MWLLIEGGLYSRAASIQGNTVAISNAYRYAIWSTSTGRRQNEINIQYYLTDLESWCKKWKILLNPEKTKAINFYKSKLKKSRNNTKLQLYGKKLTSYKEVKFLGVIFDQKLTFKKHIEKKSKEIQGTHTPSTTSTN